MKYGLKNFSLIILTFLGFNLFCAGDLPELSSDDPIEYNESTGEITARKNAELTSDKAILRADEIHFNQESSNASATGNVIATSDGLRLVTDSICYNIPNRLLNATHFKAGQSPIYVSGNSAYGTIDDLCINNPTVYFGEPDWISPNFTANKVEILNAPDNCTPTQIIGEHIFFKIGKIPFFYLPYYSHTTREIPLDIYNENGSDNKLGRYTRNTILFEVLPYVKFGSLIDYYTHRGFLAGPAMTYEKRDLCDQIEGIFQSGFIYDKGTQSELGVDSLGQPIGRKRYFIEWRHQQNLTEELQITGQLRKWSDSASLRDFRPKLFNGDQDPDNWAEAVYSGPNYYLTAFTRFSPNNFQNIEQRLPELNFNLLPTQIGCTPVYNTLNAKVGHLIENNPRTNVTLKSTRMDLFYGLHAPLYISDAFTFTPVLGGEINQYFDKNTSAGMYTRYRGQIGFDAQFNAYGQWECENEIWDIYGIRNIIRPTISYRFIPEGHSGTGPVPDIDRRVFTTNIQPIDLAYLRDVDDARGQHTIRFGYETLLQTRDKCYGSRELASLKMYQDYLIKGFPKGNHWSYWYTELAFSPAYWINFKLYDRVNVRNWTLNELTTSIAFTDARFWALKYEINTLHHVRNQNYIDAVLNLTPRTFIRGRCRYDFKLHEVTEEIYAINTRIGNAWQAELQVIHRKHAIRESDWEVTLLFNLIPINTNLLPISL